MGAGGRAGTAAVVLALALAACGDDEPDGPSKEQYVRAANQICSDNAAEIEAITDLTIAGGKAETWEIRIFVEDLGPALDVFLLQMRQLEKPSEEVPDVERLVSIYERTAADAKAAGKSDRASIAFMKGLDRRIELIDEAARAAGMPNCGGKA